MAYTYEQLSKKTVEDLREIAKGVEHEAVKGFTQMNKEHLLPALCKALGIESHVHHHVEGLDKNGVKAEMRRIKAERAKAIEAHDTAKAHELRRKYHNLNRRIRRATV